ncbi:MAG: hypothetical protein J5590_09175 [Clostridia bacterium]|nr:hypothetical protein [Clostridia bacterium]
MGKAKWKTEKELKNLIDKYFSECIESGKPQTMIGLAVFLSLTKEELLAYRRGDYDMRGKSFSKIFKMADMKFEEYAESLLFTKDKGHTALMFYLKSNYGWSDKLEEETGDDNISVNITVV